MCLLLDTAYYFQERDILHPRDERHSENQRASDLVTLSREAVERDFFSQWISDELLGKFHRLIGHRFKVSHPRTFILVDLPCAHLLAETFRC